ncbi:chromate transporter [Caulobacter ginsengisoli]|uniref:Chromate transporter n=1 Tax=Caulobacter ginsengisoli TaxID=400775 RepID=A0ABU0IKY2_9CAUL|nr:chromate efflux transporter [Caulobacter ginsengisoli]MDQ0462671.1 chromate transporter [Caulobacter ginsengisoli]
MSERRSAFEVFKVALTLGLTAFGGPIAHLGYYERTYVQRRQWVNAEDYAAILALTQILPGPASSQTGFLIGWKVGGWPGGLAAWLGFTLPSALLMLAFALVQPWLGAAWAQVLLHGLQLAAVAAVGQAVWSMGKRLWVDTPTTAIGLAAAAVLLVFTAPWLQLAVILAGGAAGLLLRLGGEAAPPLELGIGRRTGAVALAVFAVLMAGSLAALALSPNSGAAFAGIFYRAGALVFGGGHVVLPLLREALVPAGWLGDEPFLAGYGAAQALPGPLFTFAAYLGAVAQPDAPVLWAAIALLAIFLPGLLLAMAGAPLMAWMSRHPSAGAALAGINAAVVGLLAAALYNPIWTSAVKSGADVAIAAVAVFLLQRWRAPPIAAIGVCVVGAVLAGIFR